MFYEAKLQLSYISDFKMAERVGFETTRRFPAYLISSQAPSTELGHLSNQSDFIILRALEEECQDC